MTDAPYLPWRESRGVSSLSDIDILKEIGENDGLSINQLSRSRRSKSQLRLQCKYLERIGLVNTEGNELYSLSNEGQKVITGELKRPQSDGYFDLNKLLDLTDVRITDLSLLNQQDIKQTNYDIFRETRDPDRKSEHEYSVDVRDPRQECRKVLSAKKWKLDRIIREFPRTEPITSQCAHWVTTLVSFHLFPDANHRTAMLTLGRLMMSNEIIDENHEWPGSDIDIGKAVLLSKYHRHLYPERKFERLWKQNTLYWHWHQYFKHLLFDIEYPALTYHTEQDLREKLKRIREN
ncbi:hypothetical protein [Halorubrum amylolyticum]|uniref:hypothetical protein n=1 Tax=Halorubrum amylolyticum TaxID=2508724 RepID=UPI001008BE15|nr:hypothetical protein [Halorubrum amylolyticum]